MVEKKESSEKEEKDSVQNKIAYAIESEEVPKIYANGFTNFLNNSDIGIILQLNNQPKAVINISYTLAKTLHEKLGHMVKEFEETSGHKIMTTDFISETLKKQSPKKS